MESKTKTSLGLKAQYTFCILSATYFIGRCIACWCFNVQKNKSTPVGIISNSRIISKKGCDRHKINDEEGRWEF